MSGDGNANKAALLIGINYNNTGNQLRGCENDIYDLKKILINIFNFKEENILVLVESSGNRKPTHRNILKAIDWLVEKNEQGCDSLWFQYSGHGTQVKDTNGDEIDGKDEAIVTCDNKLITDDLLFARLINKIKEGTKMMAIMDCCHSGSILDLHYNHCGAVTNKIVNTRCKSKADIVALSGCMDAQTSADAKFNATWNGALTKSLVKALNSTNYNLTCNSMMSNIIRNLRTLGFNQFPQLTCTVPLNNESKFCCANYKGDSNNRPYLC